MDIKTAMPDVSSRTPRRDSSRVPEQVSVALNRRAIIGFLYACAAALIALSAAGQIVRLSFGYPNALGLIPLLYVDLENNVPTWFGSVILLTCGVLAGLIAIRTAQSNQPFTRHWILLALILLAMSLDEVASIHERTMEPLQRVVGIPPGPLKPTWVLLGIPVAAVVALAYVPFFRYLDSWGRRQTALAAALFLGGALGVEMATSPFWTPEKDQLGFVVLTHVEELLEMAGVLTFMNFLLARLDSSVVNISVR